MTDGYYQCDRCSKFERGPQRDGADWSQSNFAEEKYRRIGYGHRAVEKEGRSTHRHVDLCEECRQKLTDWLNGGEGE